MKTVVLFGSVILSFLMVFTPSIWAQTLPHLLDSGIDLKDSRPNGTTYYFSVQVGEKSISQLTIDLPMGVEIQRWIDVVDSNNRPVGSSYERIGQKAIVKFAKPIECKTKLSFYIHGIQAKTSQTWKLPISVQLQGNQEPVSIGIIRIKI